MSSVIDISLVGQRSGRFGLMPSKCMFYIPQFFQLDISNQLRRKNEEFSNFSTNIIVIIQKVFVFPTPNNKHYFSFLQPSENL